MLNYPNNESGLAICKELKVPLPVSDKAKAIHLEIVKLLSHLNTLNVDSCLDISFKKEFVSFLSLFEQYQSAVLDGVDTRPSCKKGCSCCCNHWVEDVNSFEAEIIVEYISRTYPEEVSRIIQSGERDLVALENIEKLMDQHPDLAEGPGTELDQIDLLLSIFYQLKKPCPLLDVKGNCMVYHIRPLTCRIYMSFSEPILCKPENINRKEIPTYLLDVEENAGVLLDNLHFRFLRYEGDTGLRSLLSKYLMNL